MLGGFFDELQQCVGRPRSELVRLVDDVDLVAAVGGDEHRSFPQLARVVDQAVSGGVHLDHIEAAGTVGGQRDAGLALLTRL